MDKQIVMTSEVEEIVREASALMLTDKFEVRQKDGYTNIVTSSDIAVQRFLTQRLAALLPGSGFLCEEEDSHRIAGASYVWIIDPIDGTANYSRGIDQCAISVALMSGGEITMGVVYMPRTDEMYCAARGQGAQLNGKPIHVSSRPMADGMMCTALPVYHKEGAALCSRIIGEVFARCNDVRRFGSAATELCYLAEGRVEMYFEYQLSPWDYAAASLIVREAGGCISNLAGAAPSLTSPSGILAANTPTTLAALQEIVAVGIANSQ